VPVLTALIYACPGDIYACPGDSALIYACPGDSAAGDIARNRQCLSRNLLSRNLGTARAVKN
jgi:hypothetical protein